MTDPQPLSAADRIAALRQPAEKRRKPAYSSKILTAGMSTTAMLGLVTAMGWQTGRAGAQTTTQTSSPSTAVTPAAPATPALPVATPPSGNPVTATPVVIPVAVPVAPLPVQPVSGGASNATTNASA